MPWYFGWNVILVAVVFQAFTWGIGIYSFTLWAVPWADEFSADFSDIMVANAAAFIASGVLSPFVGRAFDRMSVRVLICIGITLFTSGLVLVSFTTAIWQIIFLYSTLIAIGMSFAGPIAGQKLSANWFRARRGLAIGLVTLGTSIGGIVLPPVISVMISGLGWRQAHLMLALVFVFSMLPLSWIIIRNTPTERGIQIEEDSIHSKKVSVKIKENDCSFISILRERIFWLVILSFLPLMIAFQGTLQNMGPYSADIGIHSQQVALLISLLSGCMIAGKIFFSSLVDRVDCRHLSFLVAFSLFIAMVLLMIQPDFEIMLLISVLIGLSVGGFLPLIGSIVANHFGPHIFGQVMGMLYAFLTLSACGSVFSGWVRESTGTYIVVFQIFIVLIVFAGVAISFLPKLQQIR